MRGWEEVQGRDGATCCGPTRNQIHDAVMRGETIGTWERCSECAEQEARLVSGIFNTAEAS